MYQPRSFSPSTNILKCVMCKNQQPALSTLAHPHDQQAEEQRHYIHEDSLPSSRQNTLVLLTIWRAISSKGQEHYLMEKSHRKVQHRPKYQSKNPLKTQVFDSHHISCHPQTPLCSSGHPNTQRQGNHHRPQQCFIS